nr:hypothetical protein [Tanacetum cinerariifolium]
MLAPSGRGLILYQSYGNLYAMTEREDGVTSIKRRHRDSSSDGVRDLVTALGRARLKVDLESSTWRRRQVYFEIAYDVWEELEETYDKMDEDPLLDVKDAFNIVSMKESHRGLHLGSSCIKTTHYGFIEGDFKAYVSHMKRPHDDASRPITIEKVPLHQAFVLATGSMFCPANVAISYLYLTQKTIKVRSLALMFGVKVQFIDTG